MGLDLLAFSQLSKVCEYTEDYTPDDSNTLFVAISPQSLGRIQRPPGIYLSDGEIYHTRIGSYSTYNIIRNIFSEEITGYPAEVIWNTNDYKGYGISYLVDFSDCEGILDTYYCNQIYTDLEKYKDKIVRRLNIIFGYQQKGSAKEFSDFTFFMEDIINAFYVGSQNGCVIFC